MITRRKLLAFLGLGGAAAAVASKVEAAPQLPAGVTTETLATKPPLLVATVPQNSTMAERQAILDQLQALTTSHEVAVVERGTTISAQTLVAEERAGEKIRQALEDEYERKIFGIVESIEPDGKAWVRIGGPEAPPSLALSSTKPVGEGWSRVGVPGNARYVCRETRCGKPVPHDAGDGCVLIRVWGE